MPDPQMKTVSASQVAALFNASPYQTRWMLWQQFAHGLVRDEPESVRMKWGKLLEPLILEVVAAQHKLEIHPNYVKPGTDRDIYRTQKYFRRGLLGATRDATIVAPDKGPGAVEVKCVFDYSVWMNDWHGGRLVPRHHEIQLQTQMKVGDGDGGHPFQWGLIVAWVCADLYFFERQPIIPLWTNLDIEAARFFGSIEKKEEPEPFGAPMEVPWLTEMFPIREGATLDLSNEHAHVRTAEDLRQLEFHKAEYSGNHRAYEHLRARLLALAKDNQQVFLPCGYKFRVQKSGKGKTIVPLIPDVPLPPPPAPEPTLMGG